MALGNSTIAINGIPIPTGYDLLTDRFGTKLVERATGQVVWCNIRMEIPCAED